jgi:hypothetical protein
MFLILENHARFMYFAIFAVYFQAINANLSACHIWQKI